MSTEHMVQEIRVCDLGLNKNNSVSGYQPVFNEHFYGFFYNINFLENFIFVSTYNKSPLHTYYNSILILYVSSPAPGLTVPSP